MWSSEQRTCLPSHYNRSVLTPPCPELHITRNSKLAHQLIQSTQADMLIWGPGGAQYIHNLREAGDDPGYADEEHALEGSTGGAPPQNSRSKSQLTRNTQAGMLIWRPGERRCVGQ